ncbi:hypothetical protein EV426DRAFT_3315 [Tirmania nivea]|nr:hypothetical protein EV426DRAFT_3315 [Tirmania nivea]
MQLFFVCASLRSAAALPTSAPAPMRLMAAQQLRCVLLLRSALALHSAGCARHLHGLHYILRLLHDVCAIRPTVSMATLLPFALSDPRRAHAPFARPGTLGHCDSKSGRNGRHRWS